MRHVFAAILMALFCASPAAAQSNADFLQNGWEWWKNLSETARQQLAPKLIEYGGMAGSTLTLAAVTADNTAKYRALCQRKGGTHEATALCKGLQYRFAERSDFSTVFKMIEDRVGTATAPAREAAAIAAGLRKELGLEAQRHPARTQYLLAGLYRQFGSCSPPACQPGLQPPRLKELLTAAVAYAYTNGNNPQRKAAESLRALGWQ